MTNATANTGFFQRPGDFKLTDAEFKELQQTIAQQRALAVKDFDVTNPSPELQALGGFGDGTSPPPHWLERGEPSRQS